MQARLDRAYSTKLRLEAPMARQSREQILEQGHRADPRILTDTHTCYSDIRGGCGICVHCRQKDAMIQRVIHHVDVPIPENY